MQKYKTANDIINTVAVETGIPGVSNIFSATDPAIKQLITLANSVGYELLQEVPWSGLIKRYQFSAAPPTESYPLPEDYAYMVDRTVWDDTNDNPVRGPVSSQEWAAAQADDTVSTARYIYRLQGDEIFIYPTPVPGTMFRYDYVPRGWVRSSGGNRQDSIRQTGDVVLYEGYMFERLLKARFLEARGFDSATAVSQFKQSFAMWYGLEKGAEVLNAGRSVPRFKYLDICNLPDTGYGGIR